MSGRNCPRRGRWSPSTYKSHCPALEEALLFGRDYPVFSFGDGRRPLGILRGPKSPQLRKFCPPVEVGSGSNSAVRMRPSRIRFISVCGRVLSLDESGPGSVIELRGEAKVISEMRRNSPAFGPDRHRRERAYKPPCQWPRHREGPDGHRTAGAGVASMRPLRFRSRQCIPLTKVERMPPSEALISAHVKDCRCWPPPTQPSALGRRLQASKEGTRGIWG
jgi:hypothetical protein